MKKSFTSFLWLKICASLLLGLFIATLGRDENLFYLLSQLWYMQDLLFASFATFLLIQYLAVITNYSFRHQELKASAVLQQTVLGLLVPVILISGMVQLYYKLAYSPEEFNQNYYRYEFPVIVFILVLLNLVFSYLKLQPRVQVITTPGSPTTPNTNITVPEPKPAPPAIPSSTANLEPVKTVIVEHGFKNIPIPVQDIAFIYKEEEFLGLKTFAGNTYRVSQSLDGFYQQLPPYLFFRVNRQFIINRRACKAFVPEQFGKLSVELLPAYKAPVTISQKKAAIFKNWIAEHQN
ncbi:LytR/AlgR family response regulator transcription factor [Adhaeribacter radiodurans]|uniref:LytTR family transcriptional regulator n=1 Tax=Adhaeribacter radiodurans TaxID=2745197 RepID=A0A7L7LDA5_9BACT|nr:LytTR family DNA-binding domain-containing protein [Adhaeribacter radiodurans]QMU30818.1 LytTR family transcriptional regulator [Adhaeribacter radiodurans]